MNLPRLGLLLLIALFGVARPAHADAPASSTGAGGDTQRAVREATDAGFAAYDQGHFERAREHFEKAWRLRRSNGIALGLAGVDMKLGRYLEAAELWQYLLDHTDDGKQRAHAEKQLAECLLHLGRVRVQLDVQGATLSVGGKAREDASLVEEIRVEPGSTTLLVERAGYRSQRKTFVVKPGELLDLPIHLEPEPPASAREGGPAFSGSPADPSITPLQAWVVVGGAGLTLVTLGVGAIYRVEASRHENSATIWRDHLDTTGGSCHPGGPERPQLPCSRLDESRRDEERAQSLATAAFVTSAVLGAATLTALFFWPSGAPETPAAPESARWSVEPWSSPEVQGALLSGSF